jgi:hypothetical protein
MEFPRPEACTRRAPPSVVAAVVAERLEAEPRALPLVAELPEQDGAGPRVPEPVGRLEPRRAAALLEQDGVGLLAQRPEAELPEVPLEAAEPPAVADAAPRSLGRMHRRALLLPIRSPARAR